MRPASYVPRPRTCRNCRFVSALIKTAFLRTSSKDDVWCCTKGEAPPKLPPGAGHVVYVEGFLSKRAQEESGLPPEPKLSPEEREKVTAEFDKAHKKWVEDNTISFDGSCSEHEFG